MPKKALNSRRKNAEFRSEAPEKLNRASIPDERATQHVLWGHIRFALCPHQESNLDFFLRREVSYPLNDGSGKHFNHYKPTTKS